MRHTETVLHPGAGGLRATNYTTRSGEKDSLDLGVEDEHEGTTGSTDDVGERSLEEGLAAFLRVDLGEAIHGSSVHEVLLGTAGLHHESSSDGVEGVGDDTGGNGNDLGEGPHGENVGVLGIGEHHGLTSVEHTEVRGSVGNDTNDGDTETSVEACGAVGLGNLHEAVNETVELSGLTGTDISSKTGSGEVKRVDEAEGSGTSGPTGSAVTEEELVGVLLGVVGVQGLLVEILAGEVEGLGGEVSDDVSHVSSPEGAETLLSVDTGEAVADTLVSLVDGDFLVGILDLEEELDTLNGGNEGLGDSGGDTTDEEISNKGLLSFLGSSLGHCVLGCVCCYKGNRIFQSLII